ncbi:hypothetical protein [uncultured Sphingomonas sp.]|uniref:hypothetical protein n=1 Tax=uncultured Sphingomonas sp. TaxID=158754 RepID=UPI0025F219BB|nr:hypothetical protein [uncultured Sphingomonas sp.]
MTGVVDALAGGVTIAAFEAWLDGADVGATLIVAWGGVPPRKLPIWDAAAAADRDGLVRLHHKRRDGGGWNYVAVRADPPIVVGRKAPPRSAIDDEDPTEIVFRALKRAANFGQPCPTNADLARAAGLRDAVAASYRVRLLRQAKRIVIDEQGPGQPRIVTIVGTGKSTKRGVA